MGYAQVNLFPVWVHDVLRLLLTYSYNNADIHDVLRLLISQIHFFNCDGGKTVLQECSYEELFFVEVEQGLKSLASLD